jgi:hypothetical protein
MQAWRSFSAETSVCGWRSFDVGAMVFFLRKAIWTVPDFTVDR